MRILRALPVDRFVLSILATVLLACVLPVSGSAAGVVDDVVKVAVALLFFLYGTRLSTSEALDGLRHWRLHATVLTVTFVVFPLIGLALTVLRPHILSPTLYTGLLFTCLVPSTVQSSIGFTATARGNVPGAIVSASLSNLLGVIVTPLLVVMLMSTTGDAHITWESVATIAAQLLVPFLLGQLFRRWVAEPIRRRPLVTTVVDRGSILLIVYSAFSAGMAQHTWSSVQPQSLVAVAVVCAGVLAVVLTGSIVAARALGFSRADAIVVQFCGSKKSLASGLPMATVLFAGQPIGLIIVPLMMFHQIQLIVCSMLAVRHRRRDSEAQSLLEPESLESLDPERYKEVGSAKMVADEEPAVTNHPGAHAF